MQLLYGVPEDIEKWMDLITEVRWDFPGLETQEKLNEHKTSVLKFMDKRQAVCVKGSRNCRSYIVFEGTQHDLLSRSCTPIPSPRCGYNAYG